MSRENLSIKVAGMEISVADATKNIGEAVSDLQKRLGDLETRIGKTSVDNPITSTSASATPPLISSRHQNFSILWVDDYPANNAFLVDQFQKEGVEIKLALTTEEGLRCFENDGYDLIITDLGRRENGISNAFAGLELIKKVRKIDKEIPILVFAGARGIENLNRLLGAGASKVFDSAVEVQSFVSNHRATYNPRSP
jgi:CheY-like chemotaxis protein